MDSLKFSQQGIRKLDSLLYATNTSLLLGQPSPRDKKWKPDVKVVSLGNDESIVYNQTFESLRSPTRITLYRANITPEETKIPLLLEIQRDLQILNKIFIVIQG